jgi:hypothetical protein
MRYRDLTKHKSFDMSKTGHPLDDPLLHEDWKGLGWTDGLFARLSALQNPFRFKPFRRSSCDNLANTSSPVLPTRSGERPSCGQNHPSCIRLSA